ncbi:MAG: PAS domain S-box protein [Desulfuromonadales bacterium]|nr:PAS domain S-box protein [Desulfuromonadales bacterium]
MTAMGIETGKTKLTTNDKLRRNAEERLHSKKTETHPFRTDDETQRLIHELEVHQIELELQNEALEHARDEVEATLEKYTDLYDFAPVGYITLDRNGFISAVNLTGAGLLGIERSRLIGRRFALFVESTDRADFTTFNDTVFTSRCKQSCEVLLRNKGSLPHIIQIEAKVTASAQECSFTLIDITGRRLAEQALHASEERMYRLTEMAADAIFMLDDSGTATFCNAAAERMFGCPAESITHCDFHRLFIPECYQTNVKQGLAHFKKQGTGPLIGKTTEIMALRKDGTEFPVELSISSLKLQGKWHAIAIMRDITERKQLETENQDARKYAENIVETVRRPLVVLNSNLKVISSNQSFYSTFYATPEETIGKYIYDLGNRQWDVPEMRELLEESLHHDTVFSNYEVEHDFPTIGHRVILLNARRMFWKNKASHIILLAMEDISERKQAEERISEVMRQQQAILDNIPNMAWLKDRDGRYVAVNEPFSSLYGKAPKDLVGKSDHDIYPLERAMKYEQESSEVMESGTRTYFEESIVNHEGKTHHIEKIETPIYNDSGVFIGIIGISHDITIRKEVEVSLRHDSTHDKLTGLYNRAFFDVELERFAHGRMFPLSIVMADVNDLKTVNDTLGHEAGDNLIRMAARIILKAFRVEDIVARIGGDEFAVLLPQTDETVAEEAVQRILACPEISSCQVSIAFGIGSAINKEHLAEALKESDERMYLNKFALKKLKSIQ